MKTWSWQQRASSDGCQPSSHDFSLNDGWQPSLLARILKGSQLFYSVWFAALVLLAPGRVAAASATTPEFFDQSVRPILNEYCLKCHSTEKQKGDLDLECFSTLSEVKKHPKIWQGVIEQINLDEMPPKDKPQPTAAQREQLLAWVNAVLDEIALARAGDPGPVVLRRLSNAEYTYTIRDLTGIELLDPAREFPVDSASGEGFMNVGNSLVMSPSLVTKYLDAAKDIASHAVLLPDGIRFSAKRTRRDWTDDLVGQIRAFYKEFADIRANEKLNVDGVMIETNDKGFVPVEKYLTATLREREALKAGTKTIATVAREHALNGKYLATLINALSGEEPSPLLDGLRARWRTAKPGEAAALAAEIETWQKALWKFSRVAHIGTIGGPKAWLEPVSPLAARHELRLKIPAPADGKEISLFLAVTDAGDGNENDFVIWEQPRLVAKGRPDVLIRALGGVARAPSLLEIRLPADIAAGCEFVVTGSLDPATGAEGSAQLQVLTARPAPEPGPSRLLPAAPVLVNDGSAARRRLESGLDAFRQLFPAALCYTQIVPVDEGVTLALFHRDDAHLTRLMLDDAQQARLDRLWDELHYISHDALTIEDALAQLSEYATSVGEFKFLDPMREPTKQRAAAFRQRLLDTQPRHLDALMEFADRAWRRPLTDAEKGELRGLYAKLRAQELPHEDAIRLTLARVLVAPAFLYHAEKPGPGDQPGPVSDWELAGRLSYFLWSSAPDAELRAVAASGELRKPDVLAAQTRRMVRDPRARRLATEFACAWLHIYAFDELGEKSEQTFPAFNGLRGAMYEETIRFFTDFFQNDRPVLSILNADHTFLNEPLARHYGIPGLSFEGGDGWRRVDGLRQFARGGILGQATTLAKQSGASRTSPILRGAWVSEVLLGEKLPRPPKGVPELPGDEATEQLTVRQLTEKHTADPKCYGCHRRIDAYGFSLEAFDAIGRHRELDLGGRPVETHAKAMDGSEFDGLDGLRDYLLTKRGDAFLKQFCRKLLGYSLGRAVQLSDGPLLGEMAAQLNASDHCITSAVEVIVRSRQFREIRGRETALDD